MRDSVGRIVSSCQRGVQFASDIVFSLPLWPGVFVARSSFRKTKPISGPLAGNPKLWIPAFAGMTMGKGRLGLDGAEG